MSLSLIDFVKMALQEDLPNGDLTTDNLGIANRPGRARLLAKEDLVLSGSEPFMLTIQQLDPSAQINWQIKDSEFALSGQTLCSLKCNLIALLKAERVALNFLGHLSGIATLTRCYVKELDGLKTKILDTRKTTPLWRELEKAAVRHGFGQNHRMNLSSAILIKDNHITVAGGIASAVKHIRQATDTPIEVECRNLNEVKQAVELNVARIMLDNMNLEEIKTALAIIPPHIQTEASGNMTLNRIRQVAELGVQFISVGALTHSAPCADVSLMFDWS